MEELRTQEIIARLRADALDAGPLVAPTPVREIGLVSARDHLRRRVSDALAAAIREGLARALPGAARCAVVQTRCRALGAAEHPIRFFKCAPDVRAFGAMQRRVGIFLPGGYRMPRV